MRSFLIVCCLVACGAISGCSATGNRPPSPMQPTSAPASGTRAITVDPWGRDLRESPVPTVSLSPSSGNVCMPSQITDRPDAYLCVGEAPQGPGVQDFCIRHPSGDDEYACLDRDLAWKVLRGLPQRTADPVIRPGAVGDYVYLKLTDGTMCTRSHIVGMPPAGDYVFLGLCDDKMSYFTRFAGAAPPSDSSSPFGEGTDAQGRWLVKTGIATTEQLTSRSVETAYR